MNKYVCVCMHTLIRHIRTLKHIYIYMRKRGGQRLTGGQAGSQTQVGREHSQLMLNFTANQNICSQEDAAKQMKGGHTQGENVYKAHPDIGRSLKTH